MTDLADIGVLGLAVMGANLARNAARKGFGVAVFNRHVERTDELISQYGSEGRFLPSKEIADFVASIARPRPILIMVKAGKPVDDVIEELIPHLDEGDTRDFAREDEDAVRAMEELEKQYREQLPG